MQGTRLESGSMTGGLGCQTPALGPFFTHPCFSFGVCLLPLQIKVFILEEKVKSLGLIWTLLSHY